ncbi:MAG: hypothetical protein R3B72_26490 [Polyangiaceae bacterium]
MGFRRTGLGVVLGLWLCACGARSTLEAAGEPAQGGGGVGGGGSGASGGGGDGGAPPVTCSGLEVGLGPAVLPWPDAFFHSIRPDLVGLEDDTVALLTGLAPVESPGPAPHAIGHVELRPWSGTALIAAEPQLVANFGGRSVVGTETGRVGLYALAMGGSPMGPPQPMQVVRSVDPKVSYAPKPFGVEIPTGPAVPEMLVELEEGLLFGWQIQPSGGNAYLGLARVADEVVVATSSDSGCAAFDLEARAVAAPGGALMAVASGREAFACFNDDGVPGPPQRLQTGRVDNETLAFAVVEDLPLGEPIIYLEVLQSEGHVWVLYTTDGSTAEVAPPVFAQELAADGSFVGASITTTPSGMSGPYGAAALGSGFVVAFVDNSAGAPTLVLRAFDGAGSLDAEGAVTLPGPVVGQQLAVRTSPSQDAALIAWSAGTSGLPNPTGLVRFDCLGVTAR